MIDSYIKYWRRLWRKMKDEVANPAIMIQYYILINDKLIGFI